MNKRPTTREIQSLAKPALAKPTLAKPKGAAVESWHRAIAALWNPDLQMIVAFCLIGLLLTLNVILRYPDLGALIEQYNQF